ncbi:MAG TPA: alpha/beta fold hydrolase [Acidimicrobiales bacterium]|nr:alpha/beta fold hydrolase [Acidimicrobiales bacterium]
MTPPAVVLLHAFPLNSGMWDDQIETLGDRWRVIAPDLTGFGTAGARDDPGAYSVENYADDVADLLRREGITRAVIGGLSLGGYIAFAFYRRHRDMVAALVLADTRAAGDAPEAAARRVSQQRQVAESGTDELIDNSLDNLLSDDTKQQRPEVVARARKLMEQSPPAGVIGALDAMRRRPDASDELASIDVPVLVIVGAADRTSPPEVAARMAEQIPNATLEVLPGAGHLSNLEVPEAFNRALIRFLGTQLG